MLFDSDVEGALCTSTPANGSYTCKQPRPRICILLGGLVATIVRYRLAHDIGVLIMCATLGLESTCFELLCGVTQPHSRKDLQGSLRDHAVPYHCALFQQPLEPDHDLLSIGGVQGKRCWGSLGFVHRRFRGHVAPALVHLRTPSSSSSPKELDMYSPVTERWCSKIEIVGVPVSFAG